MANQDLVSTRACFVRPSVWLTGRRRYFSPYPLTETEMDDNVTSPSLPSPGPQTPSSSAGAGRARGNSASAAPGSSRIPGVPRATPRSHVRTSDLLAGGLGRQNVGERATLWVCDMCFKYMGDGLTWEMHKVWVIRLFSRCDRYLRCWG